MLHSLVLLLQAHDMLIAAQIKSVDPEVGAAIAILAAAIEKRKCRRCNGLGYLAGLTRCPKCAGVGTQHGTTIHA